MQPTRVCKKCERALLGAEEVSVNAGNIKAGPATVLAAVPAVPSDVSSPLRSGQPVLSWKVSIFYRTLRNPGLSVHSFTSCIAGVRMPTFIFCMRTS